MYYFEWERQLVYAITVQNSTDIPNISLKNRVRSRQKAGPIRSFFPEKNTDQMIAHNIIKINIFVEIDWGVTKKRINEYWMFLMAFRKKWQWFVWKENGHGLLKKKMAMVCCKGNGHGLLEKWMAMVCWKKVGTL